MVRNKIAILGGGLAGLAASYYSRAPLYEASHGTGGVAASDAINGFVFDRGIHILQTRNRIVLDLLATLGVPLIEHSRRAHIYSHGTYTAYPFQVNTAGLPLSLRARCVLGFLRRKRVDRPANYEEWIHGSLGSGFARTFLVPYSEKFWTVPPAELTADWTRGRVPQPTTLQVLRGALWSRQTNIGTNVDFRYPLTTAGYGAVAQALHALAGPIHTDHRATQVDAIGRRVVFANGQSVPYETLISTLPLPELVRICGTAPSAVCVAAAQLRCNSILVVNLGIARPRISNRHWVHFPEKDVCFFRISYPHNLSPDVAPDGMSAVSAEVSHPSDQPPDVPATIDRVIEDLIRVRAISREDPITVRHATRVRYGYCLYDHKRRAALVTIRQWLDSVGIIPCGRYGLWSYFWSDESILSGRKAAQLAMARAPSAEQYAAMAGS